jgi:hypothetical protein
LSQDSLKLKIWRLSWLSWSLRPASTRMRISAKLLQLRLWRSFRSKLRLTVTQSWQSSKVLSRMRQGQSRMMRRTKRVIFWLHLPRSLKTPLLRSCRLL